MENVIASVEEALEDARPVATPGQASGRVNRSLEITEALAKKADRTIELSGRLSGWLTVLLVLLVAFDVGARYLFHVSWVAEQEIEWHVLAVIALMSASYTLQQGEHVRVDVFYQYYSERTKQWMDILVPLLVVVPVSLFIAYVSVHFSVMAYDINEGSPDPGGLPYRWILKAFVPFGFLLVAIQGVAMVLQAAAKLARIRLAEG